MMSSFSKSKFYQALEAYTPLQFERSHNHGMVNHPGRINYAIMERHRFFIVFRHILRAVCHANMRIVDFGPYPGTFLRLLYRLAPQDIKDFLKLYGVGLNMSHKFMSQMAQDCGATLLEVNLDPLNPDIADRNFENRIPMQDDTADLIYAGEIIEHMVNPSWMIKEAFRILKPEGHILITTPNVCRIGNIFKLLVGRTSYERLQPIGNQRPDDEWRPHFREYALKELKQMFQRQGFSLNYAMHYNSGEIRFQKKDWRAWGIEIFKAPFYFVPHLRGDILAVFEKI